LGRISKEIVHKITTIKFSWKFLKTQNKSVLERQLISLLYKLTLSEEVQGGYNNSMNTKDECYFFLPFPFPTWASSSWSERL
jgi:hypothetical protein